MKFIMSDNMLQLCYDLQNNTLGSTMSEAIIRVYIYI